MVRAGSRRFVRVEPPRTHVKLHHRSGSSPCAMVRASSVGLNQPELMSSSTTGLVGSLPCAMVRAGSRRFVRVESPRTHVKLHHRSGSSPCAMVRASSVGLNQPELMSSSTTGLVGSLPCAMVRAGSSWFGRVEPSQTRMHESALGT